MNTAFRLRGNNPSIYVRFNAGAIRLEKKSGLILDAKYWNPTTQRPDKIKGSDERKRIKNQLDALEEIIENTYKKDYSNGIEINSDWLQNVIDVFHGQKKPEDFELFSALIQNYIDEAPYKNLKKKVGLSEGRIKNLRLFKKTWLKFELETNKGKSIETLKINKKTAKEFTEWLRKKNYSINYIGKNLSNLKAVLNDADKNNDDINLSFNPLSIEVPHESKEPEDIIYLSFDELNQIKELKLVNNYLQNARKWLVLGSFVGQRGGDLLELTPDKIKVISGRKAFVIRQQKTRKDTVIPILPEAQEIIDSGFPHKISQTKLREYFKQICKLAEINEPKAGRIKESSTGATKKGIFPKWQLVGLHTCRRSFASNYYSIIPTPVLMQITNHGTEAMFLDYIGKPPYEYAMQMLEYVDKLPKTKTLRIVKDELNGTEND